jgi:hypothetical protein
MRLARAADQTPLPVMPKGDLIELYRDTLVAVRLLELLANGARHPFRTRRSHIIHQAASAPARPVEPHLGFVYADMGAVSVGRARRKQARRMLRTSLLLVSAFAVFLLAAVPSEATTQPPWWW